MRRVVTGRAPEGTSVFVSDSDVAAKTVQLTPGTQFWQLWGSDDVVALPCDGSEPAWSTFFPPASGFRFLVWSIPPAGSATLPADLDFDAALAEMQRELPGLLEHKRDGPPQDAHQYARPGAFSRTAAARYYRRGPGCRRERAVRARSTPARRNAQQTLTEVICEHTANEGRGVGGVVRFDIA